MTELVKNLEKKGYKVSVHNTKAEAAVYMEKQITNATVGIGGSMTAEEMGLYEKLSRNNTVYWHWKTTPGMTRPEILTAAANAEVYISSVNGISEKGEIINIDGSGNRVASTIYGHKKVYLVIGKNKIAPDFESAIYRARNIAAPLNAKRLNMPTPCGAKGDRCYDCASPARICRAFSVFTDKPNGCEYEVVLINEDAGY